MTFDEFMTLMLTIFPNATVDDDDDGQLVIYTHLRENADGTIVACEW